MKEDFGPYLVMPQPTISDGNILLRAVEPDDIESIRQWRNQQMDVLRQSKMITQEEQQEYFRKYVWPEKKHDQPKQVLLAIERSGRLIGYGGLVYISWPDQRAEVSFLLEPSRGETSKTYASDLSQFLHLLTRLAFGDLNLHRIWTETFNIRPLHIATLEASGFILEGVMRDHVQINGCKVNSVIHGCLRTSWK
jgi:RimJ/RimL family protein N-acetyltransferase